MKQQSRMLLTLAAALAVAAGGGAWAFYGVFEADREQAARDAAEERLLGLEADAIERLELRARGETVALEKSEGGWKMVQPLQAAVDAQAVKALVDRLAGARRSRLVEAADPAAFGLTDPSVVVAAVAGAVRAEVALGSGNSFDGSLFVRDAAGRIATTDTTLRSALDKSAFDLRDKRIVVLGTEALRGIELAGGIRLARVDDAWRLEAPVEEPADAETVDGLVRSLQDLRATAFPAGEELAAFGLAEPAQVVTLRRGEAPALVVAFGQVGEKLYVRAGDGPVAEVPATALEKVQKTVEDLRDKRLFAFDSSEVKRVRFSGDEGSYEAALRGDDWYVLGPEEEKAKGWRMNAVVSTMRGLRADRFAPADARPASHGLAEPRARVELLDEAGKGLATLHVGTEEKNRVWVQAAGAARIAQVDVKRLANILVRRAEVVEPPATGDVATKD